jgi:hypothetical protein
MQDYVPERESVLFSFEKDGPVAGRLFVRGGTMFDRSVDPQREKFWFSTDEFAKKFFTKGSVVEVDDKDISKDNLGYGKCAQWSDVKTIDLKLAARVATPSSVRPLDMNAQIRAAKQAVQNS